MNSLHFLVALAISVPVADGARIKNAPKVAGDMEPVPVPKVAAETQSMLEKAQFGNRSITHGVCSWARNGEGSGECRENKNQDDCEEGMGEVCMWVVNGQSFAAAHESWRHKAGNCMGDAPDDNGPCGRAGQDDCVNDYYQCHWEINEAEFDVDNNTHGVCSWAKNGEGSGECRENKNQGDCEMGMGEVCMWVENKQSFASAHEAWRHKAGSCIGDAPTDNGPCGRIDMDGCVNEYYACHWEINEAEHDMDNNTHGVCSWAKNGEGSGECRENENQGDCEMGMGEVCMWVENGQSSAAAHESWRHKAGRCMGVAPTDNGPCGRIDQDGCVNEYYECEWEINEAEFDLDNNTHGACSKATNGEGSEDCHEMENQGDCEMGLGEVCMWVENGQSDAAAHVSWRRKAVAVVCADDQSFRDEDEYDCASWVGYECNKAASWYGLSQNGEKEVLDKCPMSCGLCN